MNILSRINRLEARIKDDNGDYYCQCYLLTIKDYPKRISTDWLKKDICDQCGKPINQGQVKEIFDSYQLSDERLAEAEKTYNRRQI
jgi:hypothetical protein